MRANMAAIRHARWFDAEVKHSTVKVLIRLMKDIRKRFDGFNAMNVWIIEVLVCIPCDHTNTYKRYLTVPVLRLRTRRPYGVGGQSESAAAITCLQTVLPSSLRRHSAPQLWRHLRPV